MERQGSAKKIPDASGGARGCDGERGASDTGWRRGAGAARQSGQRAREEQRGSGQRRRWSTYLKVSQEAESWVDVGRRAPAGGCGHGDGRQAPRPAEGGLGLRWRPSEQLNEAIRARSAQADCGENGHGQSRGRERSTAMETPTHGSCGFFASYFFPAAPEAGQDGARSSSNGGSSDDGA